MKWLKANPQARIERMITERPLLHACCGDDHWGDVTLDIDSQADVKGDVRRLPFKADSFKAAFADLPWTASFKVDVSKAMQELLRVAPVVYTISPWTYGNSGRSGSRGCILDQVSVAWQPGVNQALLFALYVRGP